MKINITQKALIALFCILTLLFALIPVSSAQTVLEAKNEKGNEFALDFSVSSMNSNKTVPVRLILKNAEGLTGLTLHFSYLNSNIRAVSAADGQDVSAVKNSENPISVSFTAKTDGADYSLTVTDYLWESEKWQADANVQKEILPAHFTASDFTFTVLGSCLVTVAGEASFGEKTVPIDQQFTVKGFCLGDIDFNTKVEAADARLALRSTVGLERFSLPQMIAADVDKSGIVDVSDARLILRVTVGLEIIYEDYLHIHEYKTTKVVKPTCTEKGYTQKKCDGCGKEINDNWVSAKGHHYVKGTCDVCGDQIKLCYDELAAYAKKNFSVGEDLYYIVFADSLTSYSYMQYIPAENLYVLSLSTLLENGCVCETYVEFSKSQSNAEFYAAVFADINAEAPFAEVVGYAKKADYRFGYNCCTLTDYYGFNKADAMELSDTLLASNLMVLNSWIKAAKLGDGVQNLGFYEYTVDKFINQYII